MGMDTYQKAGIGANVGYEIGTPAYPDKTHDGEHQLPLSKDKLATLVEQTQAKFSGGFFWELYKPADSQASPREVAQALCNKFPRSVTLFWLYPSRVAIANTAG